jgi:hypothetical protein
VLKRILITWFVANIAIVGLVSWFVGGWYLGWDVSAITGMLVELGLIMLPNLLLPVLVLLYGWPEPVPSIRQALGWRWTGWRSLLTGGIAFLAVFLLLRVVVALAGESIPYTLPGTDGEGVALQGLGEIIAVLLGLAVFVALTAAGEETMYRHRSGSAMAPGSGCWLVWYCLDCAICLPIFSTPELGRQRRRCGYPGNYSYISWHFVWDWRVIMGKALMPQLLHMPRSWS